MERGRRIRRQHLERGATAAALLEGRDELTPDEAERYAEEQTQKYLGISVDEFIKRADAGTLPDRPIVTHLALLIGVNVGHC